ncbi:MAG TPA: FAD-dependent oxidoreductase [Candidatus Polarisedimenticolaceae bacterium]|nr:FAD-dependent oxidoreductase [Candidatus Polarisedimenticolaceae bacterium]
MIVILGGGLAGMSAAYHLRDRPHVVLEAEAEAGGLCRTRHVDGFLFDYTGHLLHLRDPRCVAWIDELLPGQFELVERQARIRTHGVTLPFPFQANLYGLPRDVVAECLIGFAESLAAAVPDGGHASFEAWSLAVFGRGISDAFMLPYNAKLFRREPAQMTADWVSWAVPKPTLREVVRGALGSENRGMGYNATFRYPRQGGIGVLPAALARQVPQLCLGRRVREVDVRRRQVLVDDGERLEYERLVVTIPLAAFLGMVRGGPDEWSELAAQLDWSVVACLNLGIDRPGVGDGAHWIYFPEAHVPFYRVGFPTNFSASVAPAGTSSLYVEFGLRRGEPLDAARLERETLGALRREGILTADDRVLVRDWVRIDPGYVIFDAARQQVLARVLPELERQGIHAIGRYGAWTYSYMERALLDGLELAERLRTAEVGR